jgi:RNA polymerase sigma factor (TIGR02999 family)
LDSQFRESMDELIRRAHSGDEDAARELFVLLLDLLHDLAHGQMRGQGTPTTLQTTALVNEAFIKLYGGEIQDWNDIDHLIASTIVAMRQILVDRARKRNSAKRDPGGRRKPLQEGALAWENDPGLLLDLDAAMEDLKALDPEAAEAAELRIFGGLSESQIASILGVSARTVQRRWKFARSWLMHRLGPS